MKKVFAGAAVAALLFAVAGFSYSATRQGAVTPAQFKALQKRVAKLEKTSNALVAYTAGCLFKWQAITEYGDPPNNGYVYSSDATADSADFLTTALDATASGQTPSGYIVFTTTTECTTASSRLAHALRFTGAAPTLNQSLQARH